LDSLCDDLGALTLAAAIFAVEFSCAQSAFDENLTALGQIFRAGFSEFSEYDNVVPFDPLLAVAVLAREAFVGRDRKVRNRLPARRQMAQVRVLSKITNE